MNTKFFITAVLSIFVSSLAMADKMGPQGDKFYEEAAHFANSCAQKNCSAPYTSLTLFNQKNIANKLSLELQARIQSVAKEQSEVWNDTILEGDYVSAHPTQLDTVVAFYKDKKLVGYTIRYFEKAWYTGQCHYDGTPDSLKDCTAGHIAETSYVSTDLETYFTDENKNAAFEQETAL